MSVWLAYQASLDELVDAVWAEPVELHPWTIDTGGGGYISKGNADAARGVIRTEGVFMRPGARASGEAGVANNGLGDIKVVQQAVWISMEEQKMIVSWREWRQHDRIFMPERNEWYEIDYVLPSATKRPNVYLTVLQPGD